MGSLGAGQCLFGLGSAQGNAPLRPQTTLGLHSPAFCHRVQVKTGERRVSDDAVEAVEGAQRTGPVYLQGFSVVNDVIGLSRCLNDRGNSTSSLPSCGTDKAFPVQ